MAKLSLERIGFGDARLCEALDFEFQQLRGSFAEPPIRRRVLPKEGNGWYLTARDRSGRLCGLAEVDLYQGPAATAFLETYGTPRRALRYKGEVVAGLLEPAATPFTPLVDRNLAELALIEAYDRGKGIGTSLMRAILAERMDALIANALRPGFFARFGFEHTGYTTYGSLPVMARTPERSLTSRIVSILHASSS